MTLMRWTPVIAVLSAVVLSTGCVRVVDGTVSHTGAVQRDITVSAKDILPNAEEVRAAVGNDLPAHEPPLVGGIDVLANGIRNNSDAAPIECIGAISVALRVIYEKGPVTAAATQTYWNYDFGVAASSAHAAVIKLATAPEAQRLFASFAQQWQQCEGTTVTMYTRDSENTELYSKVTDVKPDGATLSAIVMGWDNHHTPPFPVEHAIAVGSEFIVDVDWNSPPSGSTRRPGPVPSRSSTRCCARFPGRTDLDGRSCLRRTPSELVGNIEEISRS